MLLEVGEASAHSEGAHIKVSLMEGRQTDVDQVLNNMIQVPH